MSWWRRGPIYEIYPSTPCATCSRTRSWATTRRTQEIVAEMRAVIGDERLMIAEVYAAIERLVRYYGEDGRGAHRRSTSTSSARRGRPRRSATRSSATRRRCPTARGPTGCSATTTGEPWLPYGDLAVNAEDDPDEMLALHRALLRLRADEDQVLRL